MGKQEEAYHDTYAKEVNKLDDLFDAVRLNYMSDVEGALEDCRDAALDWFDSTWTSDNKPAYTYNDIDTLTEYVDDCRMSMIELEDNLKRLKSMYTKVQYEQ